MQIFVKKFYSFTPEIIPGITFSDPGTRDKVLRLAKPRDRILYVAVDNKNSSEKDQGKVLGMAEIGRSKVNTLDIVTDIGSIPSEYFINGKFRWPEAIPMLRAWRFDVAPDRLEILSKKVIDSQNLRSGVTLLSPEDAQNILDIPHHEINIPLSEIVISQRREAYALSSDIDQNVRKQAALMAKRVLNTVKRSNGQTEERKVKEKKCSLSEGQLQILLINLLKEKKHICAITNQSLNRYGEASNHWLEPSVDRINSDGHYTEDNIQIVSKAANMAKSDLPPEDVQLFFEALQFATPNS